MNKQEISTILTHSGVGGLEKEIKKRESDNFKGWCIILVCLIAINCVILSRQNRISQSEIQQFKYDYATKVGKQLKTTQDSLVKVWNAEYWLFKELNDGHKHPKK